MEWINKVVGNIKENAMSYLFYVGIGLVVLIIIFILINLKKRNKKIHSTIKTLEDQKQTITSLGIKEKLQRIERIGQHNVSFKSLYEKNNAEFNELERDINDYFDSNIENISKLFSQNKYKELNELTKEISDSLAAYKDRYDILNANLVLVCKDEDELLERSRIITSNLNEIKNEIDLEDNTIGFAKASFEEFYKELDDEYEIFSEYMIRGNFFDAKEFISKVEVKINNVFNNLKNIKAYSKKISIELPSKINSLIEVYNSMKQDKYPLSQLPIVKTINESKDNWKLSIELFKTFSFDKTINLVNSMESKLIDIDAMMQNEIAARNEFALIEDKIYNRAIDLDNTYIKSMRDDASLKKKYETNNERNELDKAVKFENQKLVVIKAALDALNYGEQLYSLRLKKLYELDNQANVFAKYLGMSNDSYKDLVKISSDANTLLDSLSSKLRDLEIDLRNSKFDKLSQKYEEEFKDLYNLLNRLNQILQKEPVDIERVKIISLELQEKYTDIERSIKNDLKNALDAEQLLLKGNVLRAYITGIDNDIAKCEILFDDGRYEECVDACHRCLDNYQESVEK